MIRLMISRTVMVASLAVCLWSGSSLAQTMPMQLDDASLFNAAAQEPDVNDVPLMKSMVSGGAKLYYLGERSGLFGWFIVKNNQIQMIYLTSDLKTTIIGAMFTNDGQNVTSAQIRELSKKDKAVYAMLNGAGAQRNKITAAGNFDGGIAEVEGSSSASVKQEASGLPTVPASPGDRLYQDLDAASGVVLGKDDAAEVQIVVSPKCPKCKGTWKELRDSVYRGLVKVRLIPVYNTTGGEEAQMAANLLRAKNPLEAWDNYVMGQKDELSGDADEIALKAVLANLELVSKWNIKGYPYLVYRNKEGKVKIVQGRPERMAAVLLDLTR